MYRRRDKLRRCAAGELARVTANCTISSAVGNHQQLCGALANDDACRHRVAGHYAGHNGRVRNPEILAAATCGFSAASRSRSPSDDSRFQEKRITPNLDDTVEPETGIPKQLRELRLCTFLAC